MTVLVHAALLGWIPFSLALFALWPARRALIWSFMLGYLFLPQAGYTLSGLPDFDKLMIVGLGALLGVLIFDGTKRLASYRFHLIDVPMIIWCLSPMATSLVNGLGAYDGLSAIFGQTVVWGLPYFLARLYICDLAAVHELATAVFIGGVIYAPLCLFEVRMSPQLHRWIYGYHANDWVQTLRGGGFRPTVFLQHGLAVGMWMAATSVAGLWLWWNGTVRRLWTIPIGPLVVLLIVTTVLCKSAGALILLVAGAGVLAAIHLLRSPLPLIALAVIPLVYIGVRAPSLWDGQEAIDAAAVVFSEKRASSLAFRLDNEQLLIDKAMEAPVLGWGRWGRYRVYDESGDDISTTDGLWVISLGKYGLLGLAGLLGAMILPGIVAVKRVPRSAWTSPGAGAVLALATIVALFMVDCLVNAMINPLFILSAGSLASLAGVRRVARAPSRCRRPKAVPTPTPATA